ncbi:hypothetical protein [Rhizobium sp. A37_96]
MDDGCGEMDDDTTMPWEWERYDRNWVRRWFEQNMKLLKQRF